VRVIPFELLEAPILIREVERLVNLISMTFLFKGSIYEYEHV